MDLSTFGFLTGGYLAVNLTNFAYSPAVSKDKVTPDMFGFTLDKTVSTGISPYLEGKQDKCLLSDNNNSGTDGSVSIIFFKIDFDNKKVLIKHKGSDLDDLRILNLSEEEYVQNFRHRRSADFFRDSYLLSSRRRRAADANKKASGAAATNDMETATSTTSTTTSTTAAPPVVAKEAGKEKVEAENKVEKQENKVHEKPDVEGKEQEKPDVKEPEKTNTSQTTAATENEKASTSSAKDGSSSGGTAAAEVKDVAKTPASNIDSHLAKTSLPLTVDRDGRVSFYFLVEITSPDQEGLYNLFFHNCPSYENTLEETFVNFTIYLTEKNKDNYLSAGEMPLPVLYFTLCCVYFCTGCLWFYILRSSTDGVFKIHYLMLSLVYVKSVALLFHAINFYFIQKEGHHEEAFAILYYITHLMKGALLFVTIVLIGAGWAFVKHILSDRDKKIFIIVIPLQILANVAQIIIEETEEGQSRYTMWKEIFILVDLLCCGAILFPVVWSIRHLQDASQTDGKAAVNLAKLKIFRHFYIMIVCYIYFTRIIIYLLQITVPFQYEWVDELFRELATLIFFTVTGYKFRPASNNPYLQVSTDSDDEIEMDEVVSEIGAYEGLTKVNVKTDGTMANKRESSHEYD